MKNIVIFGAPGAGKGTQSDKLIEKYGLGHISTGDVLRSEIKNGTELGKTAKGFIDNGQLIPDELMIDILASVYDSFGKEHKGVIFDGFPRTIPQAEALKKMLAERGHKVAAMIELSVPEDELMARLINRGKESGRSDDHLATNSTNFEIKTTLSTYREEIHRLNAHHRWARFGNDLLLGFRADRAINKQEWEFLPDNLSMDFAVEARKDTAQQPIPSTTVYPQEPRYIKLVDSTFYLISPKEVVMAADKENSQTGTTIADVISPFMVATGILVIVILLSLTEWRRKKNFWWIDTALLVLTGLPGLILLAMVFSQHPTVQINFQTLILNPLNLIFVWSVTKKMRQHRVHWYYNVWAALIVVALFLQIWQDYAEGMVILALSLLVRVAVKSTQLDLRRK